jgi:predicted HicB family RNase H-like nuclease
MTKQEKIRSLKAYLEKCTNDAKSATNPHKKEFFLREIFKTNLAIDKLI